MVNFRSHTMNNVVTKLQKDPNFRVRESPEVKPMPANYLEHPFTCQFCSRTEISPTIGAPKCVQCGKIYCSRCYGKYGYCRTCFNMLTPNQKLEAKIAWRKAIKVALKMFFMVLPIVFAGFVIPVIFFRNNEPLFYSWLIGGGLLFFFGTLTIINRQRRNIAAENGTQHVSIYAELKKSIKELPPMTKNDKKKLKLVLLLMLAMVIVVIIVGVSLYLEWAARWD